MISAKDLASKLQTLQQQASEKVEAIAEYVNTVNTVITAVSFTEPNDKGDIYCRLTVANKLPVYTKNGELVYTNSILLFKNQILAAMAESPKFAIYAKMSYLQELKDGIQRISWLLQQQPIQIKFVALDAGDNYVDAVTGNQSDKIVAAPCVRYSISSIGETTSDEDI